ncbi:MAG: hypothetical protein AAB614_00765 [Patescibacteria group bacterium]
MGDVLNHSKDKKIYHGMICHTFGPGGWDETPHLVRQCLDNIIAPRSKEIAVILMGSGKLDIMNGADVCAILEGMEQSNKNLVVYISQS